MAKRRSAIGDLDYGMQHRPPDAETGAPLHDLTANGAYPADVYTHQHYYHQHQPGEDRVWDSVRRYRGKPLGRPSIFRAVPCGVKTINPGDWVTLSMQYARQHGKHPSDPSKDMCVISAAHHAKCLHTAGDSIMEWGYNCREILKGVSRFRPRKKKVK